MSNKLLALKAAIYEMGLRFNQGPSQEKINAYANDLMEYTPEQIIYAFRQVINSGSAFFPSLAEILKHLRPPEQKKEDRAPVIVAEMLKALRDFSQYDEDRMLAAISPAARAAFKALGSTWDIRMSENIETTRAQLERLVKGVISAEDAGVKIEQLQRIGINAKVIQIGTRPPMKGLDFSGFDPEAS
jgi:hypothetical protein